MANKKNTCNILGTQYTVVEDNTIADKGYDGMCSVFGQVITVRPTALMLSPDDSLEDKIASKREVLRHEVVHAFFKECGITKWQEDEDLVQWIATMFPKIAQAFIDVEQFV